MNEAFAPVPLAWMHDVGAAPERLNPLGGAIALGRPLGATGASLMTRMVYYMRSRDIRFGLVSGLAWARAMIWGPSASGKGDGPCCIAGPVPASQPA